jgi:hypothetical protein
VCSQKKKIVGKVSRDRAEGVKMRGNAAFMREGQATWKMTYGWIYLDCMRKEHHRQVSQRCWAVALAPGGLEGVRDLSVAFMWYMHFCRCY